MEWLPTPLSVFDSVQSLKHLMSTILSLDAYMIILQNKWKLYIGVRTVEMNSNKHLYLQLVYI